MPETRAGYPVIDPSEIDEKTVVLKVGGAAFRVAREHEEKFERLLTFLNAVEPFAEVGWDGGYAHRAVRGTTTVWSEHAAGAAVDINASQHPMGASRGAGFTADQVRVIRWYLTETKTGRLFRWGNDFTRPDPMHFELKPRPEAKS